MYNFKESFGLNLHNIRKNNKLTIEAFAEMLDLSARQVTRIESGENFPSAETICRICMVLDINVKTLFDFEWQDNLMYFSSGCMEKPHLKVVIRDKVAIISYLTSMGGRRKKIRETIPRSKILAFLLALSKEQNQKLIADFFEKKQRLKIIKILPNGQIEDIVTTEDIKNHKNSTENKDYDYITEKIKAYKSDQNKVEYIKLAIDALKSKTALRKVKSILKGIELAL